MKLGACNLLFAAYAFATVPVYPALVLLRENRDMNTQEAKELKVKNYMVPLSEYATVSIEATLLETVAALKKAQDAYDKDNYRHRGVLIYDEKGKIMGKVSQHDILRALEPKYEQMGSVGMRRFGFTPKFLQTMFDQFGLWDTALEDICKNAALLKVKKFMYTLTEGEYVDENASLRQAIHQLVMGHHQSMLVTRQNKIVGILKLTEIYRVIRKMILRCSQVKILDK